MGPGPGLERGGFQSGNGCQVALQIVHEVKGPLNQRSRQQWMYGAQSGQGRLALVGFRVVFHGTRSQGIHAGVHTEIPGGQACVVAHHIHLAQIGKTRAFPRQCFWQGFGRHIAPGQGIAATALRALFPKQRFI